MMKVRYIWCLVLACLGFCACTVDDDVAGIFTDKTWKLTGIYYTRGDGTEWCKDYWAGQNGVMDNKAFEASLAQLQKGSTFTLTFNGLRDGDVIQGSFTGTAATVSLSGTWQADAVKRTFGTSFSQSDNETLGRAFIEGLHNAYKYEGDYDNLRIFFKRGASDRYILLRVAR